MRNRMQPLIAGAFFAGFVSAVAPLVFAKGNELDTGSRRIPYNGTLELNGVAYSGLVDMRFTLTGAGATGTDGGSCSLQEAHNDVNVYGGKFSVQLGSVSSLPDCLFNATSVTVAVAVKDAASASTASYTSLTGSQTIRPVPFAYWAAEGSNLTVDGTVTSTGAITAGTSLNSTGDTYVGSFLYVKGSDLVLGTNDGRTTNSTNGAALVHYTNDTLHLNYNNTFEGGVQIGNGSTTTTIPGTLSISGTTSLVDAQFSNAVTTSYNANGWLTNNNQIKLRLYTDTTPANSYGFGVQNGVLFANSAGSHAFYVGGASRLTVGSTTSTFNTDLTVTGTLKGTLGITTKSGTLASDAQTLISCDANTMAISWGATKSLSAGDEDVITAVLVNQVVGGTTIRGCQFQVDENGAADGTRTGYCYCMQTQ